MIRILSALTHTDAALERCADNGAPADLLCHRILLNNLRAIDAQLATIESEQAQALPHNNDENEPDDSLFEWISAALQPSSRRIRPLPSCGKNVAGVVLRLTPSFR